MAEIPLDKDYLRKHYPDKYKELEKNKASSPTPQSKDNKHYNEAEKSNPISPSREDRTTKSFFDLNPNLNDGIKRPTEFDEFISENPNSDEIIISQTAWLARETIYIAMYLKRCIEENPKKNHGVEDWYRIVSSPFTNRIKPMTPACEGVSDVLPSILPNFEQRFREVYGKMLSVAKKANEDKAHTLGEGISDFKLASMGLYNTTMQIHSEALVKLDKLTQPTSGNAGDTDLAKLSDEPEQNPTPATSSRIWTCLKGFIKEAYRIAMRSFFDSTMNK